MGIGLGLKYNQISGQMMLDCISHYVK